ncbi:MAG TPA: serine hydrolase, partial [Oligoflexia bacterium]|nr:serine hydrolase [Oligoflexia bacterium]
CVVAEKKKKLTLTEPIQTFFPDFPSNKVTVSHLLNHSSGLLAHLDLHADFHAPDGLGDFDAFSSPILARVKYEEKIIATWRPDLFEKECVYSDFGFMLLGWMLEQIGQMPLDALFQEWVAQPAGISELQFLPITPNVLPTEDCPWRGRVLRGEVHDDNCYVLGGVAGHAGLFGTTRAVLALAKIWLLGEKPLQKKLIQKYWNTTHVVGSSRVLGWDGISQESSTGRYFSKNSRGHLGFTGTSLWIDPDRELIVTLLTNRVHPTRRNDSIKKFRPEFHDSLMHELGFARP